MSCGLFPVSEVKMSNKCQENVPPGFAFFHTYCSGSGLNMDNAHHYSPYFWQHSVLMASSQAHTNAQHLIGSQGHQNPGDSTVFSIPSQINAGIHRSVLNNPGKSVNILEPRRIHVGHFSDILSAVSRHAECPSDILGDNIWRFQMFLDLCQTFSLPSQLRENIFRTFLRHFSDIFWGSKTFF